ncbi:MAG: amidohydrolase [Caldilineaceae bacterium]|nr:amidohydrolase [Caldilineaceae bacterium]
MARSTLLEKLAPYRSIFTALRHELHTYPETAYEEQRTAALITQELESYGLEIHSGLARTGVVGILRNGSSPHTIGLRADIDALPLTEQNELPYRSRHKGKMHACGHDGHTTMLLLAARYLSETRNFDGTVVFIFQPAEEAGAGANRMIQEGLFQRFPVDAVYAMHNIPGLPAGQFAVMPGPMMAAGDYFEVVLTATGGHAALPHTTADPILAGSALVQSLQSIISRQLDPLAPAVFSVTQFHGGDATNIIPSTVKLQGTARTYSDATRQVLEQGLQRLAAGIATTYGLEVTARYHRGYPATINSPPAAATARQVLETLVGPENVLTDLKPLMTAEDFSYMLQARPGAYIWIGNGNSAGLHTPRYNFNDNILTIGAGFWVQLVEQTLELLPWSATLARFIAEQAPNAHQD